MRFGILQRYVIGEIARAFGLALLTITCVFVLLTVMSKASQIGLGPAEIVRFIPYMIPPSLPYTVPVSLLFAATVVYGRLASDNEVIAVKTAGLGVWTLLWPSMLMGLTLSIALTFLCATFIPRASHRARTVAFNNIEDLFYKTLKKDRVVDFKNWPFLIRVKDVEDRTLIGATIKKRSEKAAPASELLRPPDAEDPDAYDMIIQADRAWIRFDFEHQLVRVTFQNADIRQAGDAANEMNIKETGVDFKIPGNGQIGNNKMVEEMTVREMWDKEVEYREKIAMERKRQAIAASWYIGSGRLFLVNWEQLHASILQYDWWFGEIDKFETEIQMRMAMAWGSFFFVFLGAPVGILFARRDFLSAFISCFMPIILVYYPMVLFGVNLGKEGMINPLLVWAGNVVLGLAAWFWALPPVRKH